MDLMEATLDAKVKFIDIEGIRFPYVPSAQTTVILENGETEVRDTVPAYITNLQQWGEKKTPHTLAAALLSARKEILLSLVREMALKVNGYEAPIAVSHAVPEGHVVLDGHRIILNEAEARDHYIDSDGDRGTLLFNPDRSQCILVKFPITSHPMRLIVLQDPLIERFENFGASEWANIMEMYPLKMLGEGDWEEETLFKKAHKDVPVGLLTNAWNVMDLWETRDLPLEQRLEVIFNTHIDDLTGKPQRAIDIEDSGMKAVRKDDKSAAVADVLQFGSGKGLAYQHAWGLTSASSIGTMRDQPLEWVLGANLDEVCADILALRVGFRDIKPNPQKAKGPTFVEGQLFNRLSALGLIRWIDIPHKDPNMPASCMFFITLPNGEPVALTDVKRDNNRDEGLTWAFLLAPVYDNVTIYHEDGTVAIEPTHEFVHPANHIAKMLTTLDTAIRPFAGGDITGYFPRDLTDFKAPNRAIKVNIVQRALTDICGIYGDPCPAYHTPEGIIPGDMARAIIMRSLVIDYGQDMDENQMWEVAKRAKKLCNFCAVGSKSTSRRIRKYVLAGKFGGFSLSKKGAHPARPAKSRAQLQRAIKTVTMKAAVVKMGTTNQVLITPSGVEKQLTNEAFLPQVFNTYEALERHMEGHGKTIEELNPLENKYVTWTGEKRVCWVTDPKNSIKIGKLVDVLGNKFMPRLVSQSTAQEYGDEGIHATHDIDLLIPINELIDKYCHIPFLKDAVEMDIEIDGQIVKAMVVDAIFYRTGSASENIPPRNRRCAFRGIDSYPIQYELSQIKDVERRVPNTGFARELQAACREILRHSGSSESIMGELNEEIAHWFRC